MKCAQAGFVRFRAIAVFGATLGLAVGMLTAATPLSSAVAESVREACTHDAFRLCTSTMPDVAKTKACLAANRANLSPLCKTAFPAPSSPHRHHHHHRHHGAAAPQPS